MTILLVEDHKDTHAAMAMCFVSEDHTVISAHSASSAIEKGRSESFDVLVCDLQLPDGDGWNILREIVAVKPVIAIASRHREKQNGGFHRSCDQTDARGRNGGSARTTGTGQMCGKRAEGMMGKPIPSCLSATPVGQSEHVR